MPRTISKQKKVESGEIAVPIMCPTHPRWYQFCDSLAERLGDSLCEKHDDSGSGNFDNSMDILEDIPGINAIATLDYFVEEGIHCECQILSVFDYSPYDDAESDSMRVES